MAGDLHRVLAREGLGPTEDREHGFIHAYSLAVDFTENGHPRRERGGQSTAGGPQTSVGHSQSLPS